MLFRCYTFSWPIFSGSLRSPCFIVEDKKQIYSIMLLISCQNMRRARPLASFSTLFSFLFRFPIGVVQEICREMINWWINTPLFPAFSRMIYGTMWSAALLKFISSIAPARIEFSLTRIAIQFLLRLGIMWCNFVIASGMHGKASAVIAHDIACWRRKWKYLSVGAKNFLVKVTVDVEPLAGYNLASRSLYAPRRDIKFAQPSNRFRPRIRNKI